MKKTELESKHLAELHALAAEAGVERYRMLPRAELIEKLVDGGSGDESKPQRPSRRESPRRRRGAEEGTSGERREPKRERGERKRERPERKPREAKPAAETETPAGEPAGAEAPSARAEPAGTEAAATSAERPKRKRRRRWGRRRKGIRAEDLLLPAAPGRQAIVYADGPAAGTALLRQLAAGLADASDGADPIVLLIDPSPEELADWRREAPSAEIVAASQARHAEDAVAQATLRARDGEAVLVLIDSLSRFAESFGEAEEARELFDAGRGLTGTGSLTVVAAVERPR